MGGISGPGQLSESFPSFFSITVLSFPIGRTIRFRPRTIWCDRLRQGFFRAAGRARSINIMARKDALSNLRTILLRRRDALRSALAGDLSLLRELHGETTGDVVDAALDTAQDEISSQLAEVESRELAHIENALGRMQGGQYGLCEVCAKKIPMARLDALPYATMCIECQRELERNGGVQSSREAYEESSADMEIDVS